jgi:hypothetical protein
MTSARKIKANRANARVSTGPKTKHGKTRTAQNAFRHGLSVCLLANPTRTTAVENMAREIAGRNAAPKTVELARRIAEAQIDLQRIREAQLILLTRCLNDPEYRPHKFFTASKKLGNAIVDLLRISIINRKERKSLRLYYPIVQSSS